jgi:DNA-binding IscR family transcriptional regulator
VSECPTHPLWCKLADAVRKALEITSVKQLAETCPQRGSRTLPNGHMFDI